MREGRRGVPAAKAGGASGGAEACVRGWLGSQSPLKAAALLWMSWLGACPAPGAAPTLNHLYPAGGGLGSSNTVLLSGKFDPWPPKFWVEGGGVAFVATTNSGRVTVEVDAQALRGARWIRVFNDEGASEPRLFVVGDAGELAESEPNNAFSSSQPVAQLPATINGRLDKNGDVDSFGITVRAGEWVEARLDAYTLMSQLDAVLRLVSPQGLPLAWNHDFTSLDPRVVWQSPTTQTVVAQVFGFKYPADSSIQLTGGEGAVYRLHLATRAEPPEGPPPEPSDDSVAEAPAQFRGAVLGERAENRHRFRAVKDETYSVRLAAVAMGAPWDARLRVLDEAGKELAQNDDGEGTSDPRLDWRAPADGTYSVVVGSRTRKGSPRQRYGLTIARAVPGFRATTPSSAWILAAGTTNEVKVAVTRLNGFTNDLRVAFTRLPDGVTAEPVNAPAGNGEATLRLIATTQAPACSTAVGIEIAAVGRTDSRRVEYDLVSRGENNGVPQGYSQLLRESIDSFWLTVRPAVAPPKP